MKAKACVVLSASASKRVIAKGVASLPAVQRALVSGTVVIALGTTTGYVAEEILGRPIDRQAFVAGFIDDRFNVNSRLGEVGEIVLCKGKQMEMEPAEVLDALTAGDVVIKGGNALDPWGTVGVLMSAASGGTVGRYAIPALARGVEIVIPIGLSKSIHTAIADLARQLGSGRIDLCMGNAAGMAPLFGRVVTEADALESLFAVEVTHVANSGVGKGEGSVSLLIAGEEEAVRKAFEFVQSLADEPRMNLRGKA